jgi:hypothetical protein
MKCGILAAALCMGIAASAACAQPGSSLDPGDSTYKLFAASPTASSLTDRSNATNREWTNATAESLTELLTASTAEGYGLIRSKSVSIDIKVPLGWHAIEDFERLAIFNPERSVRIIIWRVDLDFEGVPDLEQYVARKASLFHSRFPTMQASSRVLSDGQVMGVMNNIPARKGDKEPRTIVDLLTPNPQNPKRALLMTFGTPMSRSTEFLPLLALMARDRDIKWRKDY